MAGVEYALHIWPLHEGGPLRQAMRDAAGPRGFDPEEPMWVADTTPPNIGVRFTAGTLPAREFVLEFLAKAFRGWESPFAPAVSYELGDDGSLYWSFATEEERSRFIATLCEVAGVQ